VTGRIWFDVIVGFAAALLLSWLVPVIILVIRRSNGDLLKESCASCRTCSDCCDDLPPIETYRPVFASGSHCCSSTWPYRST
jgi:hypothetical protein